MSSSFSKKGHAPSKNAMKHAVYSSDVVLQWENKLEFEALHRAFRDEYSPDGAAQEEAVFELAGLHWKKRRLNIGSQLAFHKPAVAIEMAKASKSGWEGIAGCLAKSDVNGVADSVRDMAKAQSEAVQHVCKMILERMKGLDASTVSDPDSKEAVELDKLIILAKEINVLGPGLVVPMMNAIENGNLTQTVVDQAYRPDILEKELKLHAEINRQIDKVVKRLVMLKEYRKLYCPKSIVAK